MVHSLRKSYIYTILIVYSFIITCEINKEQEILLNIDILKAN